MIAKLTNLLDEFQEEVKRKQYKKMPYNEWRNLRNLAACGYAVTIKCDYTLTYCDRLSYDITMTVHTIDNTEYVFDSDHPFGKFLYNKMKKSEVTTACNKMKDSFSAFAEAAKVATSSFSVTSKALDDAYEKALDNAYTKAYGEITLDSVKNNDKAPYSLGAWGNSNCIDISIDPNNIYIGNRTLEEILDYNAGNSVNRKENDNMNLFKGFDFGSCENDKVKVSMYGIAVQNANGTWVSYDPKAGSVIDVDILNFDGKYLYKMPVAIKDIRVSDTIVHNRKPMFVTGVDEGKLLAIDPAAGEEKVILPTKSMFGFDFVTKVVNLFDGFMGGANADTPFGNMLPLMLMSDNKKEDMLPLMFLMNGGKMDMSNPMMLYFLMGDKSGKDMLPLMFLMNNTKPQCDCDCDKSSH